MYVTHSFTVISAIISTALAANSCGCGSNTLPSGAVPGQTESLTIQLTGGDAPVQRTYLLHLPKTYSSGRTHPLYFSFHGATKNAAEQEELSQFSSSSFDPHGIIVYPEGDTGGYWLSNPGVDGSASPNDLDFVSQLLDYLEDNLCVDTSQIYAAGKSNGGGFTNVIACNSTVGGRFAAFASVSGAYYDTDTSPGIGPCMPGDRPGGTPFLEFHGLLDPIAPYDGGPSTGQCPSISKCHTKRPAGKTSKLPTMQIVQGWAQRNGCGANAPPASNVSVFDGNLVTLASWTCSDNKAGIVQHYREEQMGHCWPATTVNDDSRLTCTMCCPLQDYVFDATDVIKSFFASWTLPQTTPPTCQQAGDEL